MRAKLGRDGVTVSSLRHLGAGFLALALASLGGEGCGGSCSARATQGTACASDHERLVCEQTGGDVFTTSSDEPVPCPPERPVCQAGSCISATPLMCIEQLVGMAPWNAAIQSIDLDHDGLADVVFGGPDAQWVALAQADGSFAAPQSIPQGSLIDVNGDGVPDLLDEAAQPATVALGDGHLRWLPVQTLPTSLHDVFAQGDFDGDGLTDLADLATNQDMSVDLAIHLAAANFAAGETLHFPAAANVHGAQAFPLQTGGRRWVVEIDPRASSDLTMPPAMAQLRVIGDLAGAALGTIPPASLAADYNGDRNTDLVINGAVALGDGIGGFRQRAIQDVGDSPVGPADFDGDGHLDFKRVDDASVYESTIVSLHGTGDGHFTAGAPAYLERSVYGAVPIQINGHKGSDLIAAVHGGSDDSEIRIWRGDCP